MTDVVAVEDAVCLGMRPDPRAIIEAARDGDPSERPREWYIDAYTHPPRRYSEMTKVSVTTVYDCGLIDTDVCRSAAHAQVGQLDYAVAALLIWLHTPVGIYVSADIPIHRVPLDQWPDIVKPFSNECRRLGQIFGRGPAEVWYAFGMRRVVSLAGRTDAEADWEKEHKERTADTTPKRAAQDGVVSAAAFQRVRDYTLREVAAHVVKKLRWSQGSVDEFFEDRWWQTPRGTTSQGGAIKTALKELDIKELDLQLRPIKPTVMEMTSKKEMCQAIGMPRAEARGSTKPEPGMKKRALLALDDTASFVAGYASSGCEGTTKLGGMVLQQTPSDVAEWVSFDIGPKVWRVSNDYSNFNILHSLRSLQLVDIHLAKQWRDVPDSWARDKERAHLWIAESYNHASIKTPAGNVQVRCGLWSGHRNTARDNTILHLVYLRCISSVMRMLFGQAAVTTKERICGDDETLSYFNWGAAVCHTLVADALGFTSQVSKGLLSRRHDEFLQLMRKPGRLPVYPIANTILTFCSGNWYKDPVRDLSTTVKDISDHVWDMVLGGVPHEAGQRLAGYVLDYLMQVKNPAGELVRLEWWPLRGAGPGGHPLWGQTFADTPEVSKPPPPHGLPKHAAEASTTKETAVWEAIGHHRRAQIVGERAWQSYRHVAKNWLQREYDSRALQVWPTRVSKPETYHVEWPNVPPNRWRVGIERDRVHSARAAAKACGLPPELLGTDDMWKAMLVMEPRQRAKLLMHFAEVQKPTMGWRWKVPPLLRAV